MKTIAVVLSGCGVYDGSEIHEACAALLAVARAGAQAQACAPKGPQMHVMDHLAGQPDPAGRRDILVESARIARGRITPLDEMAAARVDAVLLPGGFGAAKNLCDFATEGKDCTVHPQVEAFLREAHRLRKPIGAMCIAPVILARVFGPELHPSLTIGGDPATAGQIEQMGARHVVCAAADVVVDRPHLMATTPAYMLAEGIADVFAGAERLVARLLEMCP